MTTYIQEMQRELDELRAYKERREREDRKQRRTDLRAEQEMIRVFHAAAKAAGFTWVLDSVEENAWGPPSRYGHYEFGDDDDATATALLSHTDKKLLLAAWLAGSGLKFKNGAEISRRWVAGDTGVDIVPLLPI